jgi:hypothetical protein
MEPVDGVKKEQRPDPLVKVLPLAAEGLEGQDQELEPKLAPLGAFLLEFRPEGTAQGGCHLACSARHRRPRKARRKAGFVATVSTQALIPRC